MRITRNPVARIPCAAWGVNASRDLRGSRSTSLPDPDRQATRCVGGALFAVAGQRVDYLTLVLDPVAAEGFASSAGVEIWTR
jgi:hypothetical protein